MIRCQVTRFLAKYNIKSLQFRGLHNDSSSTQILYPLKCRNLLQVAGKEAEIFLQGLITNDMRHFEESARSMYAMFLNTKGRIMYDVLVHKKHNDNAFMLECDKNVASMLEKHLKLYKLKRKVDILNVSNDFNVWALVKCAEIVADSNMNGNIHIYKDPRLVDLGSRIITSTATSNDELKEAVGLDTLIKETEDGYRYLRFKLGVSEGAEDLPPGTCFPLEANCDYLHGVSFFKGCYIGQELTARVHHTGIVRKRIMPLKFSENVTELDINSVISANNDPKSNVGKIKSYLKDYGLGLVRIKEGLEAKALHIGKYTVELVKPSWWPLEAPKEKQTIIKE